LRYLHAALSLNLVAALWFGLHYRPGDLGTTALSWFLGGNLLYAVLGITLAFVLKDNRAFCKYACPVSVPLRIGAPAALLKIRGTTGECCEQLVCEKVCPMDIRISEYVTSGRRITARECILCQACIDVCPKNELSLSFGCDYGEPDRLQYRRYSKVQND
ncbi:MAG TPA: hypothetical protein PKA05_21795, partial [Roseiflexaceae bacterium]|nr:hypothetical protein [Roseiflexaceae bacterium]